MSISFDKENRLIRINGKLAGYIDGSKSMEYYTEDEGDTIKIVVSESIDINPPIERKGREPLTVIKAPLMILRLPKKLIEAI